MKQSCRQPICLSRLKKKPSTTAQTTPISDKQPIRQSRLQLNQISINLTLDSSIKQNSKQSSIDDNILSESTQNFVAPFSLPRHKSQLVLLDDEIVKRVRQLQDRNQVLGRRNLEMAAQLKEEQGEKLKLNARIEVLEQQLRKLQSQFQQQQRNKSPQTKAPTVDLRMSTPPQITDSPTPSTCWLRYRRQSLYQSVDYEYKDPDSASKAKEYKNQYEIEKMRRLNLEKQLQTCKENTKLEFKNQLDGLEHKLEKMKELVTRKDREIKDKEELIHRHLINRQLQLSFS